MSDKEITFTPEIIARIGEAIADILGGKYPKRLTAGYITEILDLKFPEYSGKISADIFCKAVDDARNRYPLIANSRGHKWAETQEEFYEYLQDIDHAAIKIHTKIQKRRRISVVQPPAQRSLW